MVSAVAQAAKHSISLYNTIIVLHLCYLHLICELMLAVGTMQMKKPRFLLPESVIYAAKMAFSPGQLVEQMVFSLPYWSWHGFGFYVWVYARTFGSQPECNAATKVVVFGRELSATGSGRVASLGE